MSSIFWIVCGASESLMCILGAGDSGASTLLQILARGEPVESHGTLTGELLIDGEAMPSSAYKQVVGFVPRVCLVVLVLVYFSFLICFPLTFLGGRSFADANRFGDSGLLCQTSWWCSFESRFFVFFFICSASSSRY